MTIATITRPIAFAQKASARLPPAMISPANGRPEDARQVELRRVEAIALPMRGPIDDRRHDGLERGRRERPGRAGQRSEHEDVPEGDDAGHRRASRGPRRRPRPRAGSRRAAVAGRRGRQGRPRKSTAAGSALSRPRSSRPGRSRNSSASRTSQPCAVACIQLPMLPMNAARMNRR